MADRIGFLGLGIMGAPMAANLAGAGFEVVVWNRTAEKARVFADAYEGVVVAETPAAVAAATGMVVSMVPDVPEVEAVLLGADGAAEGLDRGGLAIDMSTISPTASRSIGERLAGGGVRFLDAPVTGSRPRAEDGTLTIMAGGAEEAFASARTAFEAMGELVLHVGPQGHGSMIKLINNTLAAVNAAGLAEGLALARAAGLDTDAARAVIGSGSGASAMLDLKAGPMLAGDYEPLFKLEHLLKDVRHMLAEARALGLEPRTAATAESLYASAADDGLGGSDFAAVFEKA